MPGGGVLVGLIPGGGAALSGPCLLASANEARPAGTMLVPSPLPKIGLSDEIARNSACCSLLPISNAIDALMSAGMAVFTSCTAPARLPAPEPGESIGDAPGPPGPPVGDLGIIGGGPAPAPGAPGGPAAGEGVSSPSGMDAISRLI